MLGNFPWQKRRFSQKLPLLSMFEFYVSGSPYDMPKRDMADLKLFEKRPDLLEVGLYKVQSKVDLAVFKLFMGRVVGDTKPIVTGENVNELALLCEEFDYSGLEKEIIRVIAISGTQEARAKKILLSVKEDVEQHNMDIQEFRELLGGFEETMNTMKLDIDCLRAQMKEVKTLHTQLEQKASETEVLHNQLEKKVSETEARLEEKIDNIDSNVQRLGEETANEIYRLNGEVKRLKYAEAHAASQSVKGAARPIEPVVSRPVTPPAVPTRELVKEEEYGYDCAKPLNGIIRHLTDVCKGNVHDKGAVEVESSSINGPTLNWLPKFAADLASAQASKCFASGDEKDSWIRYNFKNRRVKPSSYSIRGSTNLKENPKNWVLEVSNTGDDADWQVIDTRSGEDISKRLVPPNFTIEDCPEGSFQFIRLRQTGENQSGTNRLVIAGLEIFGTLLE